MQTFTELFPLFSISELNGKLLNSINNLTHININVENKIEGVSMSKILRLPQVMDITGLKKSSIYKKISENIFPPQVQLGARSVGWVESEIESWIQNKISESKTENNGLHH